MDSLNLHNVICQLHLINLGGKTEYEEHSPVPCMVHLPNKLAAIIMIRFWPHVSKAFNSHLSDIRASVGGVTLEQL